MSRGKTSLLYTRYSLQLIYDFTDEKQLLERLFLVQFIRFVRSFLS